MHRSFIPVVLKSDKFVNICLFVCFKFFLWTLASVTKDAMQQKPCCSAVENCLNVTLKRHIVDTALMLDFSFSHFGMCYFVFAERHEALWTDEENNG